ncbi:MAG TPA: lactate racemase domain-containing protein [Ignavibacteria bacterium]
MDFSYGKGSFEAVLSENDIFFICEKALNKFDIDSKRILVLIPDNTRHAPIGKFFKIINEIIGKRVKKLDFLVATGTHVVMTLEQIYKFISINKIEHEKFYPDIDFYCHDFSRKNNFSTIGIISAKEISEISNGLFSEDIEIPINKVVFNYDKIVIISPVVPHEAMGFSGGYKYFFPGISSEEFIQTFHWIASIIGTQKIIGIKDTPSRSLIHKAAEFIKIPVLCLSFVINEYNDLVCLFAGDPINSWSEAVKYSEKIHISFVNKQYKKVLAITPDIYEDLWVGSKAMYKIDSIIADDGELIIYNPKIKEISFVHNDAIYKIGYHIAQYFLKQWNKYKNESKLIMAHSINVKGSGTYEEGIEKPRITVTLATSINKNICEKVNLNYLDPEAIDIDNWKKNKKEDQIVIENAGQVLYKYKKNMN